MPESTILPINKAKTIAEDWTARLQSLPEVCDCVIAGDVRRRCETTEVIDLAVGTADFYKVMNYSAAQADVASVLAREDHTVSFQLADGARLRIRMQSPEHFGSLLVCATGSEAHLARLRQIAHEKGLTFSSGNLLSETGQALTLPNEEELYQKLGLPLIVPELREDSGEFEAAAQGKLPNLITQADLHSDLHMHSDWSDGHNSIREMAESAIAIGHQAIAIADQVPGRWSGACSR